MSGVESSPRNSRKHHGFLVGAVAIVLSAHAHARPEGTRDLGLTQSVGTGTTISVSIEERGETILICTSDDGRQEDETEDGPVDRMPGAPNAVAPERRGAEIYAFPAQTPSCRRSAECPLQLTCIDRRREMPTDALADHEIGPDNRCGIPLPVTAELGHCTANIEAENWHTLVTDRPGTWAFDFAGEPETLGARGRTTRYFEIDVLNPLKLTKHVAIVE